MAGGYYDLKRTDCIHKHNIAQFCKWIVKTCKAIPGEMVRKSLKRCCVTSSMDRTEAGVVYDSDDCGPSDNSSEGRGSDLGAAENIFNIQNIDKGFSVNLRAVLF